MKTYTKVEVNFNINNKGYRCQLKLPKLKSVNEVTKE